MPSSDSVPPLSASGVIDLAVSAGRRSGRTHNLIEITLDDLVRAVLTGIGSGASVEVTSDALAVRRFWLRFILAALATQAEAAAEAHRTRQVHPILKMPGKRRHPASTASIPEGMAVCWRCGNRPDEVAHCPACDATGLVEDGADQGTGGNM